MYLMIWADFSAKQITDNLTTADYLAVAQNVVHIFRYNEASKTRLVVREGKALLVPVCDADTGMYEQGKIHY